MKPVTIRARADADIDLALDHLAQEAPASARRFLSSLRATFEAIERFPGAGSTRFAVELDMPGLRHRSTRGFPYVVFYLEHPAETVVLRVLHQKRDLPAELLTRGGRLS